MVLIPPPIWRGYFAFLTIVCGGAVCQNACMIMRFSIVFIALLFAFCTTAHAYRLDISRLTQDGEFSATFGFAFKSGKNKSGTSHTNWGAGRIDDTGVELDYTFADDWTVSFSNSNDYSDAQIGMKYKIIKTFPLKLDIMADYGFAFTKNADTDRRIGNNNVDAGFRIHGVAWGDFQWAFKVTGQYVWANPFDFWNLHLTGELMYYFMKKSAAIVKYQYDFSQINKPGEVQHTAATVGMVYNMSDRASVHPYLKYHFKTTDTRSRRRAYDDYWKLGIEFSVQF